MAKRTTIRSRPKTPKVKERSVLAMTHAQARSFFLKPESYCSIELPVYFQFGKTLSSVAKVLKDALTPAGVFDKVVFKAMKPVVPSAEVEMFAYERY